MHQVTRSRIWRKLEVLPDEQLYQVLDFIEYLENRYSAGQAVQPGGFQRFAERVEDRMRIRSLAPLAIRGTLDAVSGIGRVLEGVARGAAHGQRRASLARGSRMEESRSVPLRTVEREAKRTIVPVE